ncbi:hypothetical protein ACFL54_03735 [Planctomycetota bacterium]
MTINPPDRRGIVLLFVLGVLALLSVLALTFVNMTRLERNISLNYVYGVRATLAAESGIEYASNRLLEAGGRTFTPAFAEEFAYQEGTKSGLQHAAKVSFSLPDQLDISGIVGDSLSRGGDFYKLRVIPEDGKLNLNDTNGLWNLDSDPEPDSNDPAEDEDVDPDSGRLGKLVEILGDILFEAPAGGLIGNALFDASAANPLSRPNLPGGRFSSMNQVHEALVVGAPVAGYPPALSENEFEIFSRYITLNSWQDPNTIRPTYKCVISVPDESLRPIPGEYRNDIYLWSDFQTAGFELEPRAPVNVNMAGMELLEALISPLQAWYLREGPGSCTTLEPIQDASWCGYFGSEMYCVLAGKSFNQVRRLLGYPCIQMQYYWGDTENRVLHGATWEPFVPSLPGGPREDLRVPQISRLGEIRLTPDLSTLMAYDPDETSGEPLPKALARELYEYIHGTDGDPNPIESWEEFEYAVDTILEELFPADSWDGLDIFWDPWNPQPRSFADMMDRWGIWWWVDRMFYGEVQGDWTLDRPYWRRHCRIILKDLFLAAFNPNTQLNDFNPDRHINRRIDKAQLTSYSTELSLQPCGVFRIESFGAVKNDTGEVIASKEIHTTMELYRPFRITTQAQFMKDVQHPNDIAAPAESSRTAWNSVVASYPEPVLFGGYDGEGNPVADLSYMAGSVYDGYIMPAAWEFEFRTDKETLVSQFDGRLEAASARDSADFYRWGATDEKWESWTNGNADPSHVAVLIVKSNGDTNGKNDEWVSSYYRPCNQPDTNRLTYPTSDNAGTNPGTLFPDGALSDTCNGIAYSAKNIGADLGARASLQFWVKPNFDSPTTSRIRSIVNLTKAHIPGGGHKKPGSSLWRNGHLFGLWYTPHYGYHKSELSMGAGSWPMLSPDSFFFYSCDMLGGFYTWNGVISPTAVESWPNQELNQRSTHENYYFDSHQWTHIHLAWGLDPANYPFDGMLSMRINGRNPEQSGLWQSWNWDWSQWTWPCPIGSEPDYWIRFGGNASDEGMNYVSDCTYDEIFIYSDENVESWIHSLYDDTGRYYYPEFDDEVAEYFSPKWNLFSEMKLKDRTHLEILGVAWTAYWPKYNRRVNYLGNAAGTVTKEASVPPNVNDLDGADPLMDIYSADSLWTEQYGIAGGWDEAYDPVSVDIAVVDSSGGIYWAADNMHGASFTYAGGSKVVFRNNNSPVRLQRGEELKFKIYFNQPAGEIAYEVPVLDDITFFVSTRKVLHWNVIH